MPLPNKCQVIFYRRDIYLKATYILDISANNKNT